MQQVFLKMVPDGVNPVIYATQNDDGRAFRFKLLNSDESDAYVLNGTETITAKIVKPDNTEITIAITNPGIGKDYCDMVIGSDDCDLAGVYIGEVSLLDYGRPLGSRNFVLKVEPDAYDGANVVVMDCGPADICTFETNLADTLVSLIANITASQDLHGYDHPWSGGAGKNKLPFFNNSKSFYGMNVVPQSNGRWNFSGTAEISTAIQYSATVNLTGVYRFVADGYTAQGSSNITLYCQPKGGGSLFAVYATQTIDFSQNDLVSIAFYASSGQTFNYQNIGLMLVLDSESDKSFAPYENICPIVGHSELNLVRCGENLFGGNFNEITPCFIKAGTEVCASTEAVEPYANVIYYDKNQNVIDYWGITTLYDNNTRKYRKFTITQDAYYFKFDTVAVTQMQVEISSSPTPYVAYNGDTFTVQFGQTVYGGVYDANRGKVNNKFSQLIDLGDLNWVYSTTGYFYATPPNVKPAPNNNTVPNIICTCYETDTPNHVYAGSSDNIITCTSSSPSSIWVRNNSYTDAAQFKTDMAGQKLIYELATPIEIDVSELSVDTIVGVNNVFADTGETELKYLKIEG